MRKMPWNILVPSWSHFVFPPLCSDNFWGQQSSKYVSNLWLSILIVIVTEQNNSQLLCWAFVCDPIEGLFRFQTSWAWINCALCWLLPRSKLHYACRASTCCDNTLQQFRTIDKSVEIDKDINLWCLLLVQVFKTISAHFTRKVNIRRHISHQWSVTATRPSARARWTDRPISAPLTESGGWEVPCQWWAQSSVTMLPRWHPRWGVIASHHCQLEEMIWLHYQP